MRRTSPPVAWISCRMRSSRRARANAAVPPRGGRAGGDETRRGALVDKQVRVRGGRPRSVAVVEPGAQPAPDGCGERDVAPVKVEPAIDDLGQPQLADLLAGQAMEGHQRHGERDGRVRRVQFGPDQGGVQRPLRPVRISIDPVAPAGRTRGGEAAGRHHRRCVRVPDTPSGEVPGDGSPSGTRHVSHRELSEAECPHWLAGVVSVQVHRRIVNTRANFKRAA